MDNKIKNIMKKAYDDLEPSQELEDRVLDTYKQNKQDFVRETVDVRESNFFRMKYFMLAGVVGVLVLIAMSAVFFTRKDNSLLGVKEIDELTEEGWVYTDMESVNDLIASIDENMDTLAMIAEDTEENEKENNKNSSIDVNIQELDDILNITDDLDDIDDMLNDDILNDEIFS